MQEVQTGDGLRCFFSITRYRRDRKIREQLYPVAEHIALPELDFAWRRHMEREGRTANVCTFRILKNLPGRSSLGIQLIFKNWSAQNYVFAPAALYNGNRFTSIHKSYPPMLTKEEGSRYRGQTVISDVPRLEKDGGGCVQLSVGDLSLPCVGYYSAEQSVGYLLFFEQHSEVGNFGLTLQERPDEQTMRLTLSAPCVRTPYKYGMCTTRVPSDDRGTVLHAGDRITFSYTEYHFPCGSVSEFLNRFFQYRHTMGLPRSHPNDVTWHYAFRLIEEKYNRRNWQDDFGFYTSSEAVSGICRQWQTGWVGGAMNTLPGILIGRAETREKSRRTLDFVFHKIQHPSGFLYGIFCDGKAYGDDPEPENKQIVMSRKNADALYYIAKLMLAMRREGETIPQEWQDGLKRLADAFVRFYEKNGEIGQFIDLEQFEPRVFGSASGGIVCAGLVLCADLFEHLAYRKTAEKIAGEYYRNYVAKGFTTGGPGEVLACPDSESAFALLESFVVLYRYTGRGEWLKYAQDTAALCASWCVGYDYAYQSDTQFSQRGTATTGAVWASVQNKHAAPGICTLSGEPLFHLYRATGNVSYLELLRDIAHNITQYVSTPEKPMYASYVWHSGNAHLHKLIIRGYVRALAALSAKSRGLKKLLSPLYQAVCNPVGRINERVNLSDWEGTNNVGEVPIGSCWCEVSAMLTYLEIPAAYIQPDTGFCFTLDHIECGIQRKTDQELTLEIRNPTAQDAEYRLFVENESDRTTPMREPCMCRFQTVRVRAHERKTVVLKRGI